jgi:hypothetical protein
MKIFLSHTQADEKWAVALGSALAEAGFEVWNPASDLVPGANWYLELGKALERSDAMIVLLSPDAVKSQSVLSEIEFALSSSQFRDRLISVLVKPTDDIPWILRRLQFIRATKDVSETAQRVVAALEKLPVAAGR